LSTFNPKAASSAFSAKKIINEAAGESKLKVEVKKHTVLKHTTF
jgi:hypothetical protein